jgi:copper transport protein
MQARVASVVAAVAVAVALLASLSVSVSAHVALVAATPVPGSTIGQPPKMVRIRFDQVPDPKFNNITILDTSGKAVAGGPAASNASDPAVIEVTITAKLTPGLYTVTWQALAPDGHLTKGNYPFTLSAGLGPAPPTEPQAVGAPTSGASAQGSSVSGSGTPTVLAVTVRWWRYLALGVLIGAFGLAVLVLRPATATMDDGDAAWARATHLLRPWALGGLIAFLLAHLATLIVQAATVADIGILQVRGDTLRRLLVNTTYGGVWRIVAVVALLLLLGMVVTHLPFLRARPSALGVIATPRPAARTDAVSAPPETLRHWQIGLGVSLLIAVALTFSSHAIESQHQPVLALMADAAHLSAMGLWFGGLLVLLLTLSRWLRPLAGEERTDCLAETVRRFSNLALVSVGCLIATGVYAMTLHTTRGTILNTSYGQTLLIKHALILPLIGTAALNLLLIKPRLRSVERARRWLPRLLWIEAGLGLAVLLVTATLTQLPPAHLLTGANAAAYDPRLNDAVAVAPPTAINADADVSSGPQAAEMQDAAGMTVVLLTSTGKDGSALDANIVDPNTSQPLADVQRVTALITFADADLGQTSVLLAKDASGHYRATGIFFPIKGVWNIQLVVRRANIAEDARLNFSFTSDPARFQTTERPGSTVTNARTGFLWPRLLPNAWYGLLLALVGVALLVLTYRARTGAVLQGRTRTIYRTWSVGALLLGLIVFGYNSTDRTPTTAIANPLPNDTATLAQGQQLFAQNCAICHGAYGKGDGPYAANLNPRPVDLTGSHLTTHTDGDLYWWVSHGIAGTGMPSFSGTLTDQDIWSIIRYVRSLRGTA